MIYINDNPTRFDFVQNQQFPPVGERTELQLMWTLQEFLHFQQCLVSLYKIIYMSLLYKNNYWPSVYFLCSSLLKDFALVLLLFILLSMHTDEKSGHSKMPVLSVLLLSVSYQPPFVSNCTKNSLQKHLVASSISPSDTPPPLAELNIERLWCTLMEK